MTKKFYQRTIFSALLLAPSLVHAAAEGSTTVTNWHAQTLVQALGYMFLFALAGVLAAIAGYKLFDKCTPGELHKEILENKNMAAAIVAAAVIIGVCIIVAASIVG